MGAGEALHQGIGYREKYMGLEMYGLKIRPRCLIYKIIVALHIIPVIRWWRWVNA